MLAKILRRVKKSYANWIRTTLTILNHSLFNHSPMQSLSTNNPSREIDLELTTIQFIRIRRKYFVVNGNLTVITIFAKVLSI